MFGFAVRGHHILAAGEIPSVSTAEADKRNDREYSVRVNAAEGVEHIPHKVEVCGHIFHLSHVGTVGIVERATLEVETPSHIGREPFAEAHIIIDCKVAFAVTLGIVAFHERNGYSGTKLDEPVVLLVDVIMRFARYFADDGCFFFYDDSLVLCLSRQCGH